MKTADAIAMHAVSKVYRESLETRIGLHDLTLSVPAGHFAALVGPNGAGKSSAIKVMATLLRPTTGSVHVFGHDTVRAGKNVRREIGYVGQENSTDMYATVHENMLYHAARYGMAVRAAVPRAEELLASFGLEKQAAMEVRRLSGGQRRRLDVAMALAHRPRLLILDEPTANLDPDARRRVWDTLNRLRQQQELTIMFSTHYLEEADEHADHVFFIDRGRCITDGSPRQLKTGLGGESLVLEFADGAQAMHAALTLGDLEGDARPLVANARIIMPCEGARHIHTVLDRLAGQGLVPQSVTLSRPSLDDVYIRLTGASFESVDLENQQAQVRRQSGIWAW